MRAHTPLATVADLVRHLGGVDGERIRLQPPPGTATSADVVAVHAREKRLCELVDGVLVEKTLGFLESVVAVALIRALESFVREHDLGLVAGPDGMLQLAPGLVRIPDVSFVRWERLPGGKIPAEPVPDLAPDLAVEVLSPSNTAGELERKLADYFTAGVSLVWLIDPRARMATALSGVDDRRALTEADSLDGGQVLPGFTLPLAELFARLP